MSKPKNRRSVTFTRGQQPPPESESDSFSEIPRASKQEIRHLIEERGATSTTEIANLLNADGFPTASAEKWTANLVDSALRRKDMDDLRKRLKENRGDLDTPGLLEIKQAAFDGAKEAVQEGVEVKLPDIPPVTLDTFAVKGAVADATNLVFQRFRDQIDASNEETAATITSQVQTSLNRLLADADLAAVRRVTDKAGQNVGRVLSKLDDATADLHDAVVGTLKDQSKTMVDACENLALQLSEDVEKQVNARFDALEDAVVTKLSVIEGDTTESGGIKALLGKVVDARLKNHLDTVVNQFAVMVDGLRRELAEEKGKRKGRR